MDSVAFEVENLNLMFNDFHALKDVNIKIPKNKIVSILVKRRKICLELMKQN